MNIQRARLCDTRKKKIIMLFRIESHRHVYTKRDSKWPTCSTHAPKFLHPYVKTIMPKCYSHIPIRNFEGKSAIKIVSQLCLNQFQTAALLEGNPNFRTTASSDKILIQPTVRRCLCRGLGLTQMCNDLPQKVISSRMSFSHTVQSVAPLLHVCWVKNSGSIKSNRQVEMEIKLDQTVHETTLSLVKQQTAVRENVGFLMAELSHTNSQAGYHKGRKCIRHLVALLTFFSVYGAAGHCVYNGCYMCPAPDLL